MKIPNSLTGVFDKLLPMSLTIDRHGIFHHVGPTLHKLDQKRLISGRGFFDVFDVDRPRNIDAGPDLLAMHGRRIQLSLKHDKGIKLKGIVLIDPDGDGAVLNLSFGMNAIKAIGQFDLTSSDFAPNDLIIEMLYLVEAKSAAMEESRKLNIRLQGARMQAEEKASTDGLTGLKNRRAMDQALSEFISSEQPFALMHLDLDYFKAVNDTFGHAAGDHILHRVAEILVSATRKNDVVARIGGDEFVIILPDPPEKEKIEAFARRIIKKLEEPVQYKNHICRISASAGTAISLDYVEPNADQILSDADMALYASKHKGRATHTFYANNLRKRTEGLSVAT
ncbi:GGDEF domain-containing protein [Pseudaestuariivita rosea]|uniref:GGDEF domain-containing protein n=1 Tax=Pseudaestuariivita rosea TaxID=2763263 RepID=UPI001ABA5B6D|nr:GGDEF domain-containing protein [Pseudaestuariivita rosea]